MELQLQGEIDMALSRAVGEHFENGMDSQLGLFLRKMVKDWGVQVVHHLTKRIFVDRVVGLDEAGEILMSLAYLEDDDMGHPETRDARLIMVHAGLMHSDIIVRDCACMAVEHYRDPSSIPHLEYLLTWEPNNAQKEYMGYVLKELRGEFENVVG